MLCHLLPPACLLEGCNVNAAAVEKQAVLKLSLVHDSYQFLHCLWFLWWHIECLWMIHECTQEYEFMCKCTYNILWHEWFCYNQLLSSICIPFPGPWVSKIGCVVNVTLFYAISQSLKMFNMLNLYSNQIAGSISPDYPLTAANCSWFS